MTGRRIAAKAKGMKTWPARDAVPETGNGEPYLKEAAQPTGPNDVWTATVRSCLEKGRAREPALAECEDAAPAENGG